MTATITPRPTRPKIAAFFVLHLVLLSAVITWGALRYQAISADHQLPPLRSKPLDVTPLYDLDVVVTDEQLNRVLPKLGLKFQGDQTAIAQIDHSLRFLGPRVKFNDPDMMSGEDMLSVLTNHQRFAEVYGEDQDPLLIDDGRGVNVRAFEGSASTSHIDHTMACLAEIGMPADAPIYTDQRQTTFRAMLEQSLRNFSLNQFEYEWSGLTYALFLPPHNAWRTTEGQRVSFDVLAERVMREELPMGVCFGNHRMHTLVVFLRVDDMMHEQGQPRILSPDVRQKTIEYLQDVTATLVRHQHPDGFWNIDWPHSKPKSSEPSTQEGDQLSDRIIATGHALEWWALAPREILPPRPVLAAAGQWIVKTIDSLTDEQIQQANSFLSHAGRALALWRSRDPAEVVLAAEAEAAKSAKADDTSSQVQPQNTVSENEALK